jgi:hypothetical protein
MTINQRSFAEISDLLGLTLVCKKCGSIALLNAGDFHNIPESCPNCKKNWYKDGSEADKSLHKLMSAIEAAKALSDDKDGPCHIMFEVQASS